MGGELGGQDDKLGAATYQKTVSQPWSEAGWEGLQGKPRV